MYQKKNCVIVVPMLVSECCARVEESHFMLCNVKNKVYMNSGHDEIKEACNVGKDIALCMSIIIQYVQDLNIDFCNNTKGAMSKIKTLLFPFMC